MVDSHFDFIWRVLRRLGVPELTVDDAAQQVFLVAAAKVGDVAHDKERSFLFAIALRVASQQRRAERRRPEHGSTDGSVDMADPSPGPEELLDRARARKLVDEILEDLPFEQRVVFVLFEMEEMTTVQIAELLQIPMGTVASRLRRGRELFQQAANRLRARDARVGAT